MTAGVIGLRARKRAALRLVPLDCGCRDTWLCRCEGPETTGQTLNGWRDASNHLLQQGITPMMPTEIGRALWRRGGEDRKLVSDIASRGGIATDDTPPERPAA